MDKERFCGIARGGVLGLRVNDDGDGFRHVIIFVYIDVADTVGMPHDGDACTAHDVLDKSVRAPRNDEVYRFAAGEELIYFAVLFRLEQGFR